MFMNLEVKVVSEVNSTIYHDRMPLVRKAMIRCCLALNINGCWEITQLLQHLQDMIQRFLQNLKKVQFNKQNF